MLIAARWSWIPSRFRLLNNLGASVLNNQGRIEEAREAYQQALALEPDKANCHSNMLFNENYAPGITLARLAEAHAEWGGAVRGTPSFNLAASPADTRPGPPTSPGLRFRRFLLASRGPVPGPGPSATGQEPMVHFLLCQPGTERRADTSTGRHGGGSGAGSTNGTTKNSPSKSVKTPSTC